MLLLEFQEIDGHLHKLQDNTVVMIIAKNLITKTLVDDLNENMLS